MNGNPDPDDLTDWEDLVSTAVLAVIVGAVILVACCIAGEVLF